MFYNTVFDYKKYNKKRMNNYLDNFSYGEELTIIGKIESVIFQSADNGFSVYTMKVESHVENIKEGKEIERAAEGQVRLTGYINLNEGQKYKVSGEIKKYDNMKQLFISVAEYIEPTSEDGIIAFLSSGLIKGVGEKTAERIVRGYNKKGKYYKGFGIDTLEVIKTNYKELTRIPGISEKKAKLIHDTYNKNIEYQNVMFFFQKFNITANKIMKIYKEFKEKSIDVVKENPYILSKHIKGFGFKVCDEIARKMGLNPHDIERIKSGIIYTLQEATQDGHCYLTDNELFERTVENTNINLPLPKAKALLSENKGKLLTKIKIDGLLYELPYKNLEYMVKTVEEDKKKKWSKDLKVTIDKISKIEIKQALEQMIICREIETIEYKGERCIYLKEIYQAEESLAHHIKRVAESPIVRFDDDIEKYIKEFESMKGFKLENKQRLAVKEIFNHNLMVLTGSAGSGKTTTVEAMLYVLNKVYSKSKGLEFMLSAPTGKASKRLSEVTGFQAKTIHRLLEVGPQGFAYNEHEKLPYDILVIDEFSMTDLFLANHLFKAVNSNKPTKIILIGDVEQLPSVGAGNVLNDIIASGKIKVVRLDVVKRQAENSDIIKNANRIIGGQMIQSRKDSKDFFIIEEDDKHKVADLIIKSILTLLNKNKYNYTIDDIQVLCPQRTSVIGTEELNKRIQQTVNPPSDSKKELKRGNTMFRVDDKVIHLKNNYEKEHYIKVGNEYKVKGEKFKGIFNGEIGKVIDVIESVDEETDEKVKCLVVKYDDFIIIYDSDELQEIDLTYASTIHKSQGSQYPVCIIPFHSRNWIMLNRNLAYTGVSRAKEMCAVIGQIKAMKRMVNNVEVKKRNTRLKDLL